MEICYNFRAVNTEREILFDYPVRMPKDVYEQLEHLSDFGERKMSCSALERGIVILLTSYGVKIEESSSRPKSVTHIKEKTRRRNSTTPLKDINGVRIITEEGNRERLIDIIQSAYPATPKFFADGKPSARDYRDPKVREQNIEKSNPNMSPLYSALHINFVFQREGSTLYDIGEVQIMTQGEFEIYKQTRKDYPHGV